MTQISAACQFIDLIRPGVARSANKRDPIHRILSIGNGNHIGGRCGSQIAAGRNCDGLADRCAGNPARLLCFAHIVTSNGERKGGFTVRIGGLSIHKGSLGIVGINLKFPVLQTPFTVVPITILVQVIKLNDRERFIDEVGFKIVAGGYAVKPNSDVINKAFKGQG